MPTSVNLERARVCVTGARLAVSGGFAPGDEGRYSNALFNFMSLGHPECEIDLTRVNALGRQIADLTVSFAQFAGQMGRKVLVTAREPIAAELRAAGYESAGQIRVVEG